MVWWSFVLGIVSGILLSSAFAFSICVYRHVSKCAAQEALIEAIDWIQGNSKSTDESNQD